MILPSKEILLIFSVSLIVINSFTWIRSSPQEGNKD